MDNKIVGGTVATTFPVPTKLSDLTDDTGAGIWGVNYAKQSYISDEAYCDGKGNIITDTYATKKEMESNNQFIDEEFARKHSVPTKFSDLVDDTSFVINCTVGIHFMDTLGEYIDDADKTYEEVKGAIENKQRIIMCLPSGALVEPSGVALRNDRIEFIVFASYGERIVDRYVCSLNNEWWLEEEYTIADVKALGDINTAIDVIEDIQNQLIGGASE